MRVLKRKYISPVWVSISHFLPSLVLLGLVIIGVLSLSFSSRTHVLGAQSEAIQIRTETVEDRIKELSGVQKRVKSEAVIKESQRLGN